jgi:predicted protein tyrosine phosphatase
MPEGPIHVDFLPAEAHRLRGRLGLTIAPGRWRRGLDASSDDLVRDDLVRLRDHFGAKVLVTLMEEFEMTKYGISALLDEARRVRLESVWFPIEDVSVPADLEATEGVVDVIVARMERGQTVVVHCLGGLGRSGTIAACVLVARGSAPKEAIRVVRKARPGALEVPSQEAFVGRFAALVGGRAPGLR